MKILYVCNEYPPVHHGGIGSFTRLIAENMAHKGYDIHVIGYGVSGLEKSFTETIQGVTIYRLKNKNRNAGRILSFISFLFSRFTFYYEVKKYSKRNQPDIIETYDWSAPLIFRIKGFNTILRLHGSNTANNLYMQQKKSLLLSYLEKRAIKSADFILSVSDHIAELTKKSFELNFTYKTIYNGVDASVFADFKKGRDKNKIIFVGRMHPYKGLEDLFAILNDVFSRNTSVYFEIVCTEIEEYIAKLLALVQVEFHPRIIFAGRVNNEELPNYYNSANVSILPSRTEAFPIIPLESMACGTPVIMADRFSAREIVEDNVDGFLVNTFDKEGFANKILAILKNQSKIDIMREATRQKIVQNFSIDKVINDNIDFYQSVIARR